MDLISQAFLKASLLRVLAFFEPIAVALYSMAQHQKTKKLLRIAQPHSRAVVSERHWHRHVLVGGLSAVSGGGRSGARMHQRVPAPG